MVYDNRNNNDTECIVCYEIVDGINFKKKQNLNVGIYYAQIV